MAAKILEGPKLTNVPNVSLGQFLFDASNKFGEKTCQVSVQFI